MNTPRLLIYHRNAKIYEEIIRKGLPEVNLCAAARPEEAFSFVEEAEIIFSSTRIPDEVLRKARRLRWFASTLAGNEALVQNPLLPESVILTKTTVYGEMMAEYVFTYLLSIIRNVSTRRIKGTRLGTPRNLAVFGGRPWESSAWALSGR